MSTQATATPATKTQTTEELKAIIAQLEKKLALKPINDGSGIKVTAKGSLSMYGLGHYPVTLTYTQWLIVAKQLPKLMAFALVNKASLFFKSDEQREAAFPVAAPVAK
jgi:hypothetical protein